MKNKFISIKFFICVIFLQICAICVSQNKINFSLRKIILNPEKQNQQIHFAVKGNPEKIKSAVRNYDGNFKYTFSSATNYQLPTTNYSFVSLPAKNIEMFSRNEFVERIEFSGSRGIPLNDTMRVNMNVNAVHEGLQPLLQEFDGTGILIGIIDAGIELKHPDFLDSLGKTRVVSLWDQTMAFDLFRTPIYGYGQVWDSTDINSQNPNLPKEQTAYYGHGSHVAGISAGNGNSDSANHQYKGMAPNANYIIVSSDFQSEDWLQTVADAVHFIFKKAEAMGKPCVINISAGTYSGSHDGKDIVAQFIDSMVMEKNGRAVVCAAGNAGAISPFHLRSNLSNETKFTWFKKNNSFQVPVYAPTGGVYFELFADTVDFNNIDFSFAADKISPEFELRGTSNSYNVKNLFNLNYILDGNGIYSDTLKNLNGERLAKIYFGADIINNGETYALYVLLNPDSSQYNFRFTTTGTGKFDVWSTANGILGFSDMEYDSLVIPPDSVFPDIVNYNLPDTNQSIVSSFSCAPHVITVGNYTNRFSFVNFSGNEIFSGQIPGSHYSTSSIGPTRDNRIKPDISAPGGSVISAGDFFTLNNMIASNNPYLAPDSLHYSNSGTSMASPAVAGLAVLFFQKCRNAGFFDFYNALTQNARIDSFTGNVPNNFWGFGKADAFQTLIPSNFSTTLKISDTIDCPGPVVLSLDSNFSFYQWNDNTTGQNTTVNQSGNYFATVTNNKGCKGRTDTAIVNIDTSLPSPPIFAAGNTFFCEGDSVQLSYPDTFLNYQWNSGENTVSIFAGETDFYKVTATANNGCNYISDSVLVWEKPKPSVPEISQNGDTLVSTPANNYQWYLNGTILSNDTNDTLIIPQGGFYRVEVFHVNGCSEISDSVFVTKTGTIYNEEDLIFNISPNPNNGKFVLTTNNEQPSTIKIYNLLGEEIYHSVINNPTFAEIDLSGKPSGIYFLYLRSAEFFKTEKLILK